MKKGKELIEWWQSINSIKRQCLWDSQGIVVTKNRAAKTATYSEIEKLYIEVIKDDFFKVGR